MAKNALEEGNPMPSATGPAGPIPHPDYCPHQCYGNRALSGSCRCRGCHGKAHGRGWKYAFEQGYLKYLVPGYRKPPPDQEDLPFPDESPAAIEDADQP